MGISWYQRRARPTSHLMTVIHYQRRSDMLVRPASRAISSESTISPNTRSATQTVTGTTDTTQEADDPEIDHSLMSIPIGEDAILQLFASEPAAFTAEDGALASRFTAHVETALERVETETRLRHERDRFEEFANIVSHDLRNPLQTLRGAFDGVAETGDREHLDRGYRALSRMETLIDDLLLLAQRGEESRETSTVSLEELATAY